MAATLAADDVALPDDQADHLAVLKVEAAATEGELETDQPPQVAEVLGLATAAAGLELDCQVAQEAVEEAATGVKVTGTVTTTGVVKPHDSGHVVVMVVIGMTGTGVSVQPQCVVVTTVVLVV